MKDHLSTIKKGAAYAVFVSVLFGLPFSKEIGKAMERLIVEPAFWVTCYLVTLSGVCFVKRRLAWENFLIALAFPILPAVGVLFAMGWASEVLERKQ